MNVSERFWSKVDKSGECWIWTGAKNAKGYGRFWDGAKSVPAQRASWIIANGDWPDGLLACHRCDTPSCVNPAHIFPGTDLENVRDCRAKGRFQGLPAGQCKRGHDMTDPRNRPTPTSGCRQCRREYDAARVRVRIRRKNVA